MFTKSKRNSTMSKQPSHTANTGKPQLPGPPSIVAADMRIVGDLETEGDAQIDGRIDGDLRTRKVTIGQGATINGSICGDTIKISGTVNGEVRGGTVILTSTAKVIGDIHHKSLSIDAGAFLQGLCKRMAADAPDAPGNSPNLVTHQPEKSGSEPTSTTATVTAHS
jgi:cytoskeletal protein CcmA (bactofilin family)